MHNMVYRRLIHNSRTVRTAFGAMQGRNFRNVILGLKVGNHHLYRHKYPLPPVISLVISELGGIFCSLFLRNPALR